MNTTSHPCDELTIEVRFLLCSQRVSASMIENLEIGSMFALDSDPLVPVLLTANDRQFAKGRVYRMGDNIAVRVEDFLEMA